MSWVFEHHDWDQSRCAPNPKTGLVDVVAHSTLKFVLLAIADHASKDGSNAWPSNETLSKQTALSIRTVQKATARLEELGLIVKEIQRGGDERVSADERPNRIRVVMNNGERVHLARVARARADRDAAATPPTTPEGMHDMHPAGCSTDTPGPAAPTPRGVQLSAKGGASPTQGGCISDTQTVLEPSMNRPTRTRARTRGRSQPIALANPARELLDEFRAKASNQ